MDVIDVDDYVAVEPLIECPVCRCMVRGLSNFRDHVQICALYHTAQFQRRRAAMEREQQFRVAVARLEAYLAQLVQQGDALPN